MTDIKFDMEKLVAKVGGPFYLTVLIQKRLKELRSSGKRMANWDSQNLLDIVLQEIMENKLELIPDEIKENKRSHDEDIENIFGQGDDIE